MVSHFVTRGILFTDSLKFLLDPIFYLHHAGLDWLWWQWQNVDLKNRLYQMGGRENYQPPYGEVTLDYQLPFPGLATPWVTLRDTMDIRLEPYCYTY